MKKFLLVGFALFPALTMLAFARNEPRPTTKVTLQDVSTQEMLAAQCRAGTRIEDKNAPGGFASSQNLPRRIGGMKVQRSEVYLQANPGESVALWKGHKGMTLFLVNPTSAARPFAASDSCLSIIQEALDRQGRWRPIEFLYSSFCGNSYHRVSLGPREYWSFAVPRYKGTYKTKLRFRLSEGKANLLSNEFEGSINPTQFKAPKESFKRVLAPLSGK